VAIRGTGVMLAVILLSTFIQAGGCARPKGSSGDVERKEPVDTPSQRAEKPTPPRDDPPPRVESAPREGASPRGETPKRPATPAPAEPPRPKETASPAPTPPPRPASLDLTALEKRLRETSAIGVFTKLSLKNQVDDLLDRFRSFHQGQNKTALARLRQEYDLLLLKVMSLLQDKDPALAHEISASREALWSLLADPAKFRNL